MNIIKDFIIRFGIFSLLFFFIVLVVSFGFPWLFDFIENATSQPLPFEGALRIAILGIHALLLLLSGAWALLRGKRVHMLIWWAFFASFLVLAGIFFGDRTHRLLEEFSWIRYSTSAFLILASLCALGVYVRTTRRSGFLRAAFWLVLAVGFLYGGLDEVMEIHEAIGRLFQKTFSYSGEVTDYVTIGYAFGALGAILLLIRARIGDFFLRYRMSAYLFLSGAGVYVFSTLFDTFDVFVHAKLRSLAYVLTTNPGFVMSDAWYLLWSVKNSLNGLEEVFEHTAALLFLIALITILFDETCARAPLHPFRAWRRRAAAGAVVTSSLAVTALIALSVPLTFPSLPVTTPGVGVTQIASRAEGLSHTDDLAFHPLQGIVIANEGGGSLYRLKNDRLMRISDSKKIIQDSDSVAATGEGVFVSDGNAGNIVRFDQGGGHIVAARSDGLVHPEGITVVDADIYILDESQKTLSRYRPGKEIENWKPSHPEWQTPEGITYDRVSDSIYITDDTTGAVFRVIFGKSIEKIARLSAPEDIEALADGSMLVTDTAWGAVFRIFPDGRKEKIIQLARMYRDTQGVTVDENGSVYLVTADGFASTSFMPSFLFRIDDIGL